jgi:uncharacterized membrane protein YccC
LERSNSSDRGRRVVALLDRAAVAGLALGLALYVLPAWRQGRLRWALWVTLISTVLHVYTSHRPGKAEPIDVPAARGDG